MRTRLSSKIQVVAKDLSFIKEGGEFWFKGDNIEDGKWVTVVGIPDEMDIDEDTEIECVDEKGNKLTCFADELSATDPEGAGVDDPAHFKVAKQLRKAANEFVNRKIAAVDGADADNNDVVDEMRGWLLKQGQFKSCIDTLTNEIATNAVYNLLLGKVGENHSGVTEEYAYDWANRLLKNQYGSMLGKLRAEQKAPEVPAIEEEVVTEEVKVAPKEEPVEVEKTASVKMAKKEADDKEVFSVDVYNETKEHGVDTAETTKIYYDLDEAIKVADELRDNYDDDDDEYVISVFAGEYEKPGGDIYGEPAEVYSVTNKENKK